MEQPPLTLSQDKIHIWCSSLDLGVDKLAALQATLSADENARADGFYFERDRNHFVAARGILRDLLGRYLRVPPAEIRFREGSHGKPLLDSARFDTPICFNISHSQGIGVFAFARERELGIDVEQIRESFATDDIAANHFSQAELNELRSLPPEQMAEGFFLCWTRKEAYVKARGEGLAIPLRSFDVSLTPGSPETLTSSDSRRWTLRSFEPVNGYAAAIVAAGDGWDLDFRTWAPPDGMLR